MNNLKIGFWLTLVSSMGCAWLLVGSPLMIYLLMTSMVFLTGLFVLKGVHECMSVAITSALVLDKADLITKIKEDVNE